jgi:hypothetical protein
MNRNRLKHCNGCYQRVAVSEYWVMRRTDGTTRRMWKKAEDGKGTIIDRQTDSEDLLHYHIYSISCLILNFI